MEPSGKLPNGGAELFGDEVARRQIDGSWAQEAKSKKAKEIGPSP